MRLELEKESGIPLYVQIKDQIRQLIRNGMLQPGDRLPPERDWAKEIGVSRNTVSMAFRELEGEGVLTVDQGRGTFVSDLPEDRQHSGPESSRKEQALELLDRMIDGCWELGFYGEQLSGLVSARIREREDSFRKARVLFIDCNEEQLHNFLRQFHELIQLDIIPFLLANFTSGSTPVADLVQTMDLIITTATHFDEVSKTLEEKGLSIEVVPVAAQPRPESLVRLTRLTADQKVGLICLSPEFPSIVKRTLTRIGLHDLTFDFTFTKNRVDLINFIEDHEVLVVFMDRFREVKMMAGDKEVIPYLHELDAGSVTLVRRAVDKVLKARRKGESR
jgi:GntR family transcriptional regulator